MEEKVFSDLEDFDMINYQIYTHKGNIGLNEVAARIGAKYDTKNKAETQSKTLEYLLPLLQSGKIKVSVSYLNERHPTEADKKKYGRNLEHKFMYFSDDTKIYNDPSQASEAIEDIRTRWASYKAKEDIIHDMINASEEDRQAWTIRSTFEQLAELFALPESGCF